MARFGMLIDTRACTGCMACRVACQNFNDLLPDEAFIRFEQREVGTFPQVGVETLPLACMHCEDAPCASVCPTSAARIGADGIVEVDQGRCIGCLYCMAACPYQVRSRNEQTGAVDKCRLCAASAAGDVPNCVNVCPGGVRIVGDLDDTQGELARAIAATGAAPIAGDLTKSKVYYVR